VQNEWGDWGHETKRGELTKEKWGGFLVVGGLFGVGVWGLWGGGGECLCLRWFLGFFVWFGVCLGVVSFMGGGFVLWRGLGAC